MGTQKIKFVKNVNPIVHSVYPLNIACHVQIHYLNLMVNVSLGVRMVIMEIFLRGNAINAI